MHIIQHILTTTGVMLALVLSNAGFATENKEEKFYGTAATELGSVEVELLHLGKRYVNLRNHDWVQRHYWSLQASVFGDTLECEELRTWRYFNTTIDRNVAQRYIYCVNANSRYGLRVRFYHDFDYLSPNRPRGILKTNVGYAEVYEKSNTDTKSGNYRNPDARLFDRFTMIDQHRLVKIDLKKDVPQLKD